MSLVDLYSLLFLVPYFLSVLISAGIGFFAWRRRNVSGATSFAVFAWLEAFMTLGFIFELSSPSLETKVFWDNMQFIGLFFSPVFYLTFALEYTGRAPKSPARVYGALSTASIVFLILILTDHIHGALHPDVWLVPGEPFPAMEYDFSPAVWAISLYCYGLFFVGIWILVARSFQLSKIYRNTYMKY